MCLSLFLAQVMGCYMFLMSLAMLIHQGRFKKTVTEFISSHSLVLMSGGLGLVLGLLIVISHNVWVSAWPVVITILGWLLLLQSLMRVFFPETFVRMVKELLANSGYLLVSWVWLIAGIYLLWAGFGQG